MWVSEKLPRTIFGKDTDEVFGYTTIKVVWFRDRAVGLFYYSVIFIICLWVFFGQILYRNDHFVRKEVHGMTRMWVTHPTRNLCDASLQDCKSDYLPLTELSYCDQYTGSDGAHQAPCKYLDRNSILPHGSGNSEVFFPTAVSVITEKRKCKPSPENGWSCDNEYEEVPGSDCLWGDFMCKTRAGKADQFYYVADINDYLVQFTSSYDQGNVRGTSLEHPGRLAVCEKQIRKRNSTMGWHERLFYTQQHKCNDGDFVLKDLRCLPGVDCARHEPFDLMEHTGARAAAKAAKESLKHSSPMLFNTMREPSIESPLDHAVGPAMGLVQGEGLRAFHGGLKRRRAPGSQTGTGGQGLVPEASEPVAHIANPESETTKRPVTGAVSLMTQEPDPELRIQHSNKWGDVFSLGRLMELAGADLDNDYNEEGWTTRQAGTVIEVRVVYNNLYPILSSFGYKAVEYYYEVTEMPLPYLLHSKLAEVQPPDYPETRVYEVAAGVDVRFVVTGFFGVFNIAYLLLMLTTALALFSTATTVTDLISLNLHPRKDNFFHMKYDVSPDFSETWECEKCRFMNRRSDQYCKGVPAWTCPSKHPPCGAPQPPVARA